MNWRGIAGWLFPHQVTLSHRERVLSGVVGFGAVALTTWLSAWQIGAGVFPFMLASMGASTVLLMGAPHSPLSQPWAFVGGHLISAIIGISCARLVPDPHFAAGLAVGLAILAMYYLRCLHPPGGATALLMVVGDQRIHALGYHFLLSPLLINVAILLVAALLLNRLVPKRRYPMVRSMPDAGHHTAAAADVKLAFGSADLEAALRDMDSYIDVTEEDLERIYSLATLHAHRRRLQDVRLQHVMTRKVVTASPDDSLDTLWETLRRHGIRGVPVVNEHGGVAGVATVVDFMKLVDWRMCDGVKSLLRRMMGRTSVPSVRQVMTEPAITVSEDLSMVDAFLMFARHGINHLPVVDAGERLVGIVTRLDLLSALHGDMIESAAA